ncbi:MAG: DUF370 domain-containing protein [Oscillospiraceae bacterium]
MYLHMGRDAIAPKGDIIAVCDIDNATWAKASREFLTAAERAGELIIAAEDIPQSFVLCENKGKKTVYLSQLSPATLAKRCETEID